MDVLEAIEARRSIRRFQDRPVARLDGPRKDRLAAILAEAVAAATARGEDTGSAAGSARTMAQAPVTILVYDRLWNPEGGGEPGYVTPEGSRPWNVVDVQSIGAAIQNMLIAAVSVGYAGEAPEARPRDWRELAEWPS